MCTGIRLRAENNAVIYARTLEFGQDLHSEIEIIPRNYSFTGVTPFDVAKGLNWKSRYALVGCNALGLTDAIVDGINEKGLAGGLFYLPHFAHFQSLQESEAGQSIAPWQLLTWILTTCESLEDVKKGLACLKVSNTVYGPWKIVPPVHAIVHNAQGASLVIEYVNGNLILHENPLGVIANSPSFDWHITNLSNYANLSPFNLPPRSIDGIDLLPLSQGTGMLGLPGDFTSPSRFVRAVALSDSAIDITDENAARTAAFHILNLFNIPKGPVRQKEGTDIAYDYTQWTGLCDLKNKRYYFHTYDNPQRFMIDLMAMNLDASQIETLSMNKEEQIILLAK